MLSFLTHSLLLAAAAQGPPPPPPDLIVTNARIEIGNGQTIDKGNIFIQGGKIVAVGADVAAPTGATVFDAKGASVYPGFIDAYTTNGLKVPDAPAAGTPPTIRDQAPPTMWHGNRKGIRGDIVASKVLDLKGKGAENYAQGITTALISSGAGTVRGIATIVDYTATGNVLNPTFGGEFSFRGGGGGGGGIYPGTLFGITATLRQTLADTQFYATQTNPTKDVTYENLGPVVAGKLPAIFSVDSAREIIRATRIAAEFNLKLIIAGGKEGYRDIDVLKAKGISVLASVDQGLEPTLTPDKGISATPVEVLKERHDTWVEHNANIKKMTEAGIPVAFSTGSIGLSDFLKNIRKLVTGGLPKATALKALTSGAAEILGISSQVGTIEPGKLANLVIMSGDFADEKSEVLSVVVEGQKIEVKK